MSCRAAVGIVVLAALAGPATGRAETGEAGAQAEARALFEQGMAALAAQDRAAATDAFERSYALFPHPGTLMNLALTQHDAGRLLQAHASFTELLRRYDGVISDTARVQARDHLAALEARLAAVSLASDPPGAALTLDGRDLGPAPTAGPVRVDPGRHVIAGALPGHRPAELALELPAGAVVPVELRLEPEVGDAPPGPAEGPAALRVEVDAEGASVSVDGAPPAPAPLERELAPGPHRLRAEAPGHAPVERELELQPAGGALVVLSPERLAPAGSAQPRSAWRRPWPWLVVGGAVLAGVVATVLGVTLAPDDEGPASRWTVRVP